MRGSLFSHKGKLGFVYAGGTALSVPFVVDKQFDHFHRTPHPDAYLKTWYSGLALVLVWPVGVPYIFWRDYNDEKGVECSHIDTVSLDQLEAQRQEHGQRVVQQLPHPYDKKLNMNKCYQAMYDFYLRKGYLPTTGHYVHMPDECSVNLNAQDSYALIANPDAVEKFNATNPKFYLYRHTMDSYYRLFVKPKAFFKQEKQ